TAPARNPLRKEERGSTSPGPGGGQDEGPASGTRATGTLFIFDEPTTGLHFADIQKLLTAFNHLVERGHSLVIIEHNLEVIKCADYVIDLGPEGGDGGGRVIAQGTPEEVARVKESYTGQYLSRVFSPESRVQSAKSKVQRAKGKGQSPEARFSPTLTVAEP